MCSSDLYPRVSRELLDALELNTALDGELVAFDDEGKLSFNALQNAAYERRSENRPHRAAKAA